MKDPDRRGLLSLPPVTLLLWALAVFAAFAPLLWAPFVYDDEVFLASNPLVTGPWPGLKAFFLSSFAGQGEYGPLNTLGHWLLYRVAGPAVFPYRLPRREL